MKLHPTTSVADVLKFIGDAILAIFPVSLDASAAYQSALRAAEEALAALHALNEERAPQAPLVTGIALHLGQVMYGNIGSRERLDFTVISSAVNETCRLEALCKALKTPLALSGTFVNALEGPEGPEGDDICDLGEHALKGVKSKARVFTLGRYRLTSTGSV